MGRSLRSQGFMLLRYTPGEVSTFKWWLTAMLRALQQISGRGPERLDLTAMLPWATKISPPALVNWYPGAAAEHRLPSTRVWIRFYQRACDTSSYCRETCRKHTRHYWRSNLGNTLEISIVLYVDKINSPSANVKGKAPDMTMALPHQPQYHENKKNI